MKKIVLALFIAATLMVAGCNRNAKKDAQEATQTECCEKGKAEQKECCEKGEAACCEKDAKDKECCKKEDCKKEDCKKECADEQKSDDKAE